MAWLAARRSRPRWTEALSTSPHLQPGSYYELVLPGESRPYLLKVNYYGLNLEDGPQASRSGSFSCVQGHRASALCHESFKDAFCKRTGQTLYSCDFGLEEQLLPNELSLSFQVWCLLRGQGRSAPPSSFFESVASGKIHLNM